MTRPSLERTRARSSASVVVLAAAVGLFTLVHATTAPAVDRYASASGFPVGSCTDQANPCDLADALAAAANGDRVHVAAGYYPNLMYGFALPSISILGAGSATTLIHSGTDPCVFHFGTADIAISGMSIGGGIAGNHQGICIDVPDGASASLTLSNSVIQVGSDGLEGIKVTTTGTGTASVRIVDTTILNNGMAGISFTGSGSLLLDRSLVVHNGFRAASTGGISIGNFASATITNSTITNNSNQTSSGGGINYTGTALLRLSNVTFYGNGSFNAGSELYATLASIDHSIISGTCAGTAPTSLSGSYSVESPGHTCSLSGNSLSDQSAAFLNLGPLADNGGPTQTIMPQTSPAPASVAIGLGGPFCQPVDQRDYVRSGPCDAGAVQVSASIPDDVFANGFESP